MVYVETKGSYYYALIKAPTVEDALAKYTKEVGDDQGDLADNLVLMERDKALIKYAQAKGEDGQIIDPKEVYESFTSSETKLLIVDGGLL